MPIFEYECQECRHHFELLVLPRDLPACPECQGPDLKNQLSILSVSSDGTRQRNLGRARQTAKKVQRDKAHAEEGCRFETR